MNTETTETRNPVLLHFVLKRHWYEEMKAGRKDIEYRAITPYWTARISCRRNTHAAFSCGYKAKGRIVRPILFIDMGTCPYPGWEGIYWRIHLGPIVGELR